MIENLIGGLILLALIGGAMLLGLTRFGRPRAGDSVSRGPNWSTQAMTEAAPAAEEGQTVRTTEPVN